MKLSERDLEFDFTDAIDGLIFDQMDKTLPNYHGIGEFHRVDFIVELEKVFLFVEVKDPGNPRAEAKGIAKFSGELNDGTLSKTFAAKFMDSFIYRWAENKVDKPIHYISLVTLEAALLLNLSDEIERRLPPMGKQIPRWKRKPAEHCQVFNIETWNESFPKWPVVRVVGAVSEGKA